MGQKLSPNYPQLTFSASWQELPQHRKPLQRLKKRGADDRT